MRAAHQWVLLGLTLFTMWAQIAEGEAILSSRHSSKMFYIMKASLTRSDQRDVAGCEGNRP